MREAGRSIPPGSTVLVTLSGRGDKDVALVPRALRGDPERRRLIGPLETALRRRRDGGHKLLVPYITGGLGRDWLDVLRAIADAGADAIEIGIPFSDPVMDGPVIQQASAEALRSGATSRASSAPWPDATPGCRWR